MLKKGEIAKFFVYILVFMAGVSLVTAQGQLGLPGDNAEIANEPEIVGEVPACTDSDGGLNYTTKGTTSFKGKKFVDSCLKGKEVKECSGSDCYLNEYYCVSPQAIGQKSDVVCPNGCRDGACAKPCTELTPKECEKYDNCVRIGPKWYKFWEGKKCIDKPTITIGYPNNEDDVWNLGSNNTIKWETSNIPKEHKISTIRLRDSSGKEHNLLSNTPNDGDEEIALPKNLASGLYTLEIKTTIYGTTVSDTSDEAFTVKSSLSILTCTDSDNGNDIYTKGNTHGNGTEGIANYHDSCLSPRTDGVEGYNKVDKCSENCSILEYYCLNNQVVSATGGSGTPVLCPYGCKNGACNKNTTPSITIVSPSGGDVWQVGSAQTVRWNSSNVPKDRKLDVIQLRNSYGMKTTLATNFENDGSKKIIVPSVPASLYTLEIKDNSSRGEYIFDSSDSFNITFPLACTDSDGGNDIFAKGTAKSANDTLTDYCRDDLNVNEAVCLSDGTIGVYTYGCINGCKNGHCIKEQEFRRANWECYDGYNESQGNETSCKPSETWLSYAKKSCDGRCNSTRCGINSFTIRVSC